MADPFWAAWAISEVGSWKEGEGDEEGGEEQGGGRLEGG
jgi:hypothetical protein